MRRCSHIVATPADHTIGDLLNLAFLPMELVSDALQSSNMRIIADKSANLSQIIIYHLHVTCLHINIYIIYMEYFFILNKLHTIFKQ